MIPLTNDVIVWDNNGSNQALGTGNNSSWPQRFAVGNPETGFSNYTVQCPPNMGDLFCAGHVWLPDGRLFVAGGNSRYTPFFEGSQVAAIWDPTSPRVAPYYGWAFLTTPMREKRWYPTVTLIVDSAGGHRVTVSGGVVTDPSPGCNMVGADPAFNTYEVFNLQTMTWEPEPNSNPVVPARFGGPQGSPCFQPLGEYPRMHLVSTNSLFMVGMWRGASRVRHVSIGAPGMAQNAFGDWLEPWGGGWDSLAFHGYGSSVLLPNVGNTQLGQDLIMILGGGSGGTSTVLPTVNGTSGMIDGGATSPAWGFPFETMKSPRMCANAVLLPTGEVLVVGGSSDYYFPAPLVPTPPRTPVYDAEIYSKNAVWSFVAPQQSPRMYHSTAVLLPSGKVLSGGGDIRSSDYEVYSPKSILGVRPAFAGSWASPGALLLNWNTVYQIEHDPLPVGVTISRLVLMRPCSVTHHSDMDQRYVELDNVKMLPPIPEDTVQVRTPTAPAAGSVRGSTVAPRGYYMAFLVASNGQVSTAKWVRLP